MVFSKKLIKNVKDDEKNRKKEFEIKKAVLKGQVIPFYQKIIDNNTLGNQRRYKLSSLRPEMRHSKDYNRKTIAYARVSSHDQKADLERQKQVLEMYCASLS